MTPIPHSLPPLTPDAQVEALRGVAASDVGQLAPEVASVLRGKAAGDGSVKGKLDFPGVSDSCFESEPAAEHTSSSRAAALLRPIDRR